MCLFTDEQREIGQNCNIYKLPYVCNFLLGYMFFFFFFFEYGNSLGTTWL